MNAHDFFITIVVFAAIRVYFWMFDGAYITFKFKFTLKCDAWMGQTLFHVLTWTVVFRSCSAEEEKSEALRDDCRFMSVALFISPFVLVEASKTALHRLFHSKNWIGTAKRLRTMHCKIIHTIVRAKIRRQVLLLLLRSARFASAGSFVPSMFRCVFVCGLRQSLLYSFFQCRKIQITS